MDGNTLALTGFLALLMTPVVSFIKKEQWSEQVKFLTAVLVSALVASVQVVLNSHAHSVQDFAALWGTALATTQAVYIFYFQNSKLDKTLSAVGSKVKQVTGNK